MALRVGVEVESCSAVFLYHFFRHLCCRMVRSAATPSEKSNRRNFRSWNRHGQRSDAIPDAEISVVRFCTVRYTQYDRLCWQQLGFFYFMWITHILKTAI